MGMSYDEIATSPFVAESYPQCRSRSRWTEIDERSITQEGVSEVGPRTGAVGEVTSPVGDPNYGGTASAVGRFRHLWSD